MTLSYLPIELNIPSSTNGGGSDLDQTKSDAITWLIKSLFGHSTTIAHSEDDGNIVTNPEVVIKSKQDRLKEKYQNGELDIPKIAQLLGEDWDIGTVILWLEQNNIARSLSLHSLSEKEEIDTLNFLASIQYKEIVSEFNKQEWIHREVRASQRIEAINVTPEYW